MKKHPSLIISPLKDNENIVKARVFHDGNNKEFFVYAISQDDLYKLERNENKETVRDAVANH